MQGLFAAIAAALLVMTSFVCARDASSPRLASDVLALLQSGEIGAGASDAVFANEPSGASVTHDGDYTVYSFEGLNVTTDRISLMSHNGTLFYAYNQSCSDSETYFKDTSRYLSYLLQAR